MLPAAANPLNPRTSPFFSSKRSLVIAPHPSELPLPSLSLTPKKIVTSEDTDVIAESVKQEKIYNNSIEAVNLKSNGNDNSNMEGSGNKEKHISIKQCK